MLEDCLSKIRSSAKLLEDLAMNLNVDRSTVCRIISRFDTTGDVKKAKHPKGQSSLAEVD